MARFPFLTASAFRHISGLMFAFAFVAMACSMKRMTRWMPAGSAIPLLRTTLSEPEVPLASKIPEPVTRRHSAPLPDQLRAKGYNECMLPDPGPGLYAPYRSLPTGKGGRMFIPQESGHTSDFGYDVLIHFHGHEPVRKTVSQITRGIVYVGLDLGNGSGPYEDFFATPATFRHMYDAIEKGLRAFAHDDRAHVRHVAISAWSAGYGAVNAILRHHADRVDAVVLLDGLHAGFVPGASAKRNRVEDLSALSLAPTVAFAERAVRGEKIFYFSHSHVETIDYASTSKTAAYLLAKLGLQTKPTEPTKTGEGLWALAATVDVAGFHIRDYQGVNEHAHCLHTSLIEEALGDIIEPAWHTPLAVYPPASAPVPAKHASAAFVPSEAIAALRTAQQLFTSTLSLNHDATALPSAPLSDTKLGSSADNPLKAQSPFSLSRLSITSCV